MKSWLKKYGIGVFLGLILVYFAFLLFYQLGYQSFRIDEGYSSYVAKYMSLEGFYKSKYFLSEWLQALCFKFGGINDFWARFPSVVIHLVSMLLMYLIPAKLTKNKYIGMVSFLVFGLLYREQGWARDARFYSLVQMMFLLGMYVILMWMERGKSMYLNLAILITGLGVIFHPFLYCLGAILFGAFLYQYKKHWDRKSLFSKKYLVTWIIVIIGLVIAILFGTLGGAVLAGGGGGRIISKDTSLVSTSEKSDTSVKKEDKTSKVEESSIPAEEDHTSATVTGETVKNVESHPTVTEEVLTAYQWSYKNEVTTLAPVERAMPEGYVYRGHMAKMVVNYAINVLGWELPKETPEECARSDDESEWESKEIKNYARMSCELGIMGIDMENFEPTRYVTRAQFGTVLSRLLWGDTYNQKWSTTNSYYERHLNELKDRGIVTQIDNPEQRIELREWVWIMLMRSDEYRKSDNNLLRTNIEAKNIEGKTETKEENGIMSNVFDSLFKRSHQTVQNSK